MGLFRKRNETYNEKMLREAGLDRVAFNEPTPTPPPAPAEPETLPPATDWRGLVAHGRLGPKDWDAATTVTTPGLLGDRIAFVALPNGDLIIEEEEGNGDLSPLADAVELHVTPPYRARATRQEGDLWGVGAKEIEVAQFPFPDADELGLSQSDGESEFRVDGEPSNGSVPVELQRLGEREGGDFAVDAKRIDDDFWEVRVSRL